MTNPHLDPTIAKRAVIGTSDDAAISKLSATEKGYFEDPFLHYFVPQPSRRPPLINRGYYARVAAIRAIVREWLSLAPTTKKRQIVSLGAGSDTIYFQLKAEGIAPERYVEVDFVEAIQHKAHIIARHPQLSALCSVELSKDSIPSSSNSSSSSSNTTSSSPSTTSDTISASSSSFNTSASSSSSSSASSSTSTFTLLSDTELPINTPSYALIGADLREVNSFDTLLRRANVDFSLPTLFLSECVLIYVHPSESSQLITYCATQFPNENVFVCYEQIRPFDAFGQTMISNLSIRGCSLLGYEAYPDFEAQQKRFVGCGYDHYMGWDMNEVYSHYLPRQDIKRIERLELFDEFEEWYLIQAHYHIGIAIKNAEKITSEIENLQKSTADCLDASMLKFFRTPIPRLQRRTQPANSSSSPTGRSLATPSPTQHANGSSGSDKE